MTDCCQSRYIRRRSPVKLRWLVGVHVLLLAAGCTPPPPLPITDQATSPAEPIDFARQVEPIFARHCYECHGPDEEEGGLRLDEPARRTAGGKSGSVVIVPGKRSESLLYQYITGQNEDHVIMPPKDHGQPLSPQDCEIVGRWIDGLQ